MRKVSININQLSLFDKAKALPRASVSAAMFRGEAHLVSFLYCVLLCALAGYVYFVGLSIMNVIANREATLESERLQNQVAVLEQEHFELGKSITAAGIEEHRLAKPVATSFVKRDTGVAVNLTAQNF